MPADLSVPHYFPVGLVFALQRLLSAGLSTLQNCSAEIIVRAVPVNWIMHGTEHSSPIKLLLQLSEVLRLLSFLLLKGPFT